MTAKPRRSILLTALLTVCALCAASVGAVAGADEIGDKQAEAEAVAGQLAEQARAIVALDKEHRAAQDRLGQTEVALDQAETELTLAVCSASMPAMIDLYPHALARAIWSASSADPTPRPCMSWRT